MLTARAYLDASADRIPGCFGPLDFGMLAHTL
jgi:hypothetical protein